MYFGEGSEKFQAPRAKSPAHCMPQPAARPTLRNRYLSSIHMILSFLTDHNSISRKRKIFFDFHFYNFTVHSSESNDSSITSKCYTKSEPRVPFHLQWTKATNMTIIKYTTQFDQSGSYTKFLRLSWKFHQLCIMYFSIFWITPLNCGWQNT